MTLAYLLTATALVLSQGPAPEPPEAETAAPIPAEANSTSPEKPTGPTTGGVAAAPEADVASGASSPSDSDAAPGAFASWWNGHESIYDRGFTLNLGATFSQYNGGRFRAEGANDEFESAGVEQAAGIRLDLTNTGRYFGFVTFGAAYYQAGKGTALRVGGQDAAVTLRGVDLRLMQPRFRFARWRFELAAVAGPVLHLGWAKLDESRIPSSVAGAIDPRLRDALDSSFFATVGVELGAGLRFFPLSILFAEVAYGHSFPIWNIVGETEGMSGLRFGLGLAF